MLIQKSTISFRHFRQHHAAGRAVSSFGRRTSSAPSRKLPLRSALPPDGLGVQMHGMPQISHPRSMGVPQTGQFINRPPCKNKTHLVSIKRQSAENTLRYHSSCRKKKFRPLKVRPVTGACRRRLLSKWGSALCSEVIFALLPRPPRTGSAAL